MPSKRKLKVVCISDTHYRHSEIDLPKGDILVHAGDMTLGGTIPEIVGFNRWLGTIKHNYKYIIVIAGNHDRLFEMDRSLGRSLMTNAIYLQDEMIEIEGRKIYGTPWTREFRNWAFMLPEGAPLKEKWDLIPDNLDLLITHGPPLGILDTLREAGMVEEKGRRFFREAILTLGCHELYKTVMVKKPKFHIFGHIHDGYGELKTKKTFFANVATCTEKYLPVNPPVIIKI